MRYCKRCLTPDTRPRVTFKDGVCNACLHSDAKREIDWKEKKQELEALCNKFRKRDTWDVIVPFSGGKDSVYVAWQLRDRGMTPLLVTLVPHLETEIGKYNRELLRKDFDCLTITPKYEKYRDISIKGFKEQGRPKLPFVTGIGTAVMKMALRMAIPFIMYGEEGETEYGGNAVSENMSRKYLVDCYYSGHDPSEYGSWWKLPAQVQLGKLSPTWYSKFENWSPRLHADFAKEKGMKTEEQVGTFTDYSQLSDKLQDLHAFMMFVKFGFGRCTSDVNIEIHAGRMNRDEGKKLVQKLDGIFPTKYLEDYLDYFKMDADTFRNIIEKHADKKLVRLTPNPDRPWVCRWTPGAPNLDVISKKIEQPEVMR